MTWYDPADLDDPPPHLLGLLELEPRPGLLFELRLERFDEGGPCVGAWLDEWGRHWAVVPSGQA